MLRIEIFAVVHPTEDRARVEQSILNLFPDAKLAFEKGRLSAESESLAAMLKKVRSQAIPDATRAALVRHLEEDEQETSFDLGKQAAFVGKVNFADMAHPLGDLHVVVKSERLMDILNEIAPEPERGDRTAQRRREKRAVEGEFLEHYTDYAAALPPKGADASDEEEDDEEKKDEEEAKAAAPKKRRR